MNKEWIAFSVLFLLASFLLFYNLDDRLLWGDEAETALLAGNITKFAVPKATDGRNYIALLGKGIETNQEDIWIWSPWFDEYVAAFSFKLLGKSTTNARLPFVLIALFSVIFLAAMVQGFFRNKELTFIVVVLIITNVGFLLHARQCRYYSLLILAQLFLIKGYYTLLYGKTFTGIAYTVLSLVMTFYSNYILVIPNLLALLVTTTLMLRKHPGLIRKVAITLVAFALIALPWLLYARPWNQASTMNSSGFIEKILFRIQQINFYILPLFLFLIPLLGKLNFKKKSILSPIVEFKNEFKIFLWLLVFMNLLVLGFTHGNFFRYILPLIPVLILLISIILTNQIQNRLLRYFIVSVISFSNVISVVTFYPLGIKKKIEMPVFKYISGITHKYENTLEDVVQFLKDNAHPQESILVEDPEFPLIFYTDMRVIDSRLNPYIEFKNLPDWIFTRTASGLLKREDLELPDMLKNEYERVILRVHDSPRGDNRPDPEYHVFQTKKKWRDFIMYKKVKNY